MIKIYEQAGVAVPLELSAREPFADFKEFSMYLDYFKPLINAGMNLDSIENSSGLSLLQSWSVYNNEAFFLILLNQGSDPNFKGRFNDLPLNI